MKSINFFLSQKNKLNVFKYQGAGTILYGSNQLRRDISKLKKDGKQKKLVIFDCMELPQLFSIVSTMGLATLEKLAADIEVTLTETLKSNGVKIHAIQPGCYACLFCDNFTWSADTLSHKLNRSIPNSPVRFRVHSGSFSFHSGQYEPDEIIRRALVALQEAGLKHISEFTYSHVHDAQKKEYFSLFNELSKALSTNTGLYMVYQPKISLRRNKVTGFEALLRWRHPLLGEIPPSKFLPIIENSALMAEISQRVIQLVIQQVKEWKGSCCSLPVSINMHISDINSTNFPDRLERMVNESGINVSDIGIECLENQSIKNMDYVYKNLSTLKEKGFIISLDDFGEGNSNINYLGNLPFNVVKLDRSLIRNIPNDNKSRIIAKNIISMLKQLGYLTLAEGVEDGKTLTLLNNFGCDEVQGYFYSAPLNAEHMLIWTHAFNHNDILL